MSSSPGHIRLLVILVLFLALLSIFSIVLSVVSINTWGRKDAGGSYDYYRDYYYNNYGKDNQDGKIVYPPYPYTPRGSPVVITTAARKRCYTIAFGGNYFQQDFIDEADKCALKGWGPAIVQAACQAAGIKCKIVLTPYNHCINYFQKDDYERHPNVGDGLYYGAIDACGGWFPDQERHNVAGFTDGWMRNPKAYMFYDTSSGPPSGTIKIGFAHAPPWNEKCLGRYLQRLSYTSNELIPHAGEGAVIAALQNGDIQLAFLSDLTTDVPGGFSGVTPLFPNDPMRCAEGEAGLMTRKCEWEFIQEFNRGLRLIKQNGIVRDLCNSVTVSSPDQNGQWCPYTVWA